MNKDYWPIKPTFISDCKEFSEKDFKLGEVRHPNVDGLLKVDELRGFLADSSDDENINNPLSLFQIVPRSFKIEDNRRIKEIVPKDVYVSDIIGNRRIIRIDPGVLYSNFHCCELFRRCNKGENKYLCYESDSRIALLYHSRLSLLNFETDFEKCYEVLNAVVDEYNKYKRHTEDLSLKVFKYRDDTNDEGRSRLYISYKCEYSHLEEFFFPVIYAGRVVAVLMQGQRFPDGMKKEDLFNGYIDDSPCGVKLKRSINQLGIRRFGPSMSKKRLLALTKRIENLEKRISEKIYVAAQSFINDRFSLWQKEFRNKIKGINGDLYDSIGKYNKYLCDILKEIFEEFHKHGFIRIYTLQNSEIDEENQEEYKFELIGDSSCAGSSQYKSIYFSTFPMTKDVIEKEELLKFIKKVPSGFNKNTDVFRMEVPIMAQKAYIIWKRYDGDFKGAMQKQDDYYRTMLKSMYHTLLEPYFILEGTKFEKKLEASMRISVHESAQVIPSVIDAINNEESLDVLMHGKAYNGNPVITKPMHQILDASNRLLLLEGLFRRSTLIFKKDPPRYQWHDFHRIIYATKSLFDTIVYRKKSQSLHVISDDKFSQYQLLTDYAFLSHALFNLVDNATKYGRKGSKIYLKVNLEYDPFIKRMFNRDELNFIRISVISFGNEIPESSLRDIFKLYYRQSTNEIEGMGIGLFLVKKICNSLKYKADCLNSEKVYDIDLPLHYCYCMQNDLNNVELPEKYIQKLKTTIPGDLVRYVVNNNAADNWEVTDAEVEELLTKSVFKNEFQITIPVKINENIKEL